MSDAPYKDAGNSPAAPPRGPLLSRFADLPLSVRVTLGTLLLFLVATLVQIYLISETVRARALAEMANEVATWPRFRGQALQRQIERTRQEVLFLSQIPSVRGIVRASLNRGVDPLHGESLEVLRARLTQVFTAFANANPDDYQVRLIGVADDGRELVRVDRVNGHAEATPRDRLQQKGGRDYFRATLPLRPGQVYLSEINLNREHGRVEVPHVRTLRASVPVYASGNRLFGMVVINRNVGPALDSLGVSMPHAWRVYLMNDAGDYLVHPDRSRTFGFDLGTRYRWRNDVPGSQSTSGRDAAGGATKFQGFSLDSVPLHGTGQKLHFDPERPARYLTLVYALPDAAIDAKVAEARRPAIVGALLAAAVFVIVLYLSMRRMFAPLTGLTQAASEIGKGNYDTPLPKRAGGEIGTFARAFAKMLAEVRLRDETNRRLNAELAQKLDALGESEERLRRAQQIAHLGGWELNLVSNRLYWSDEVFRIFEIDPTQFGASYEAFLDAVHPEDREKVDIAYADSLRTRVPYSVVHRVKMADGRIKYVEEQCETEFGSDGKALYSRGTALDVTERIQAELRIRRQLEHLSLLDRITRAIGERLDLKSTFQVVVRTLEDSLPVDFGCVCLHDPEANTLTVTSIGVKSEALGQTLALDEETAIGVDANGLGRCVQGQLVYEPDVDQAPFPFPQRLARAGLRSMVMAPLKSESRVFGVLVAARRRANAFDSVECEFLRQLSEHVALAAHQAQLYGSLQQAYDELRQTQEAAMQEERLRALGQMASGIAHDINNALSPVSLYTESMLETEKNLSERARGYLETIQRAVEDVAHTVARMREFYRKREEQLELAPVDLNQMVRQVLDLTKARWGDMAQQRGVTIRVVPELAADLPKIMGVESEIREALTNLVFNAVDAMPAGGTLSLRTRLAGAEQGQSVVVEVIDTGIGMDEQTRRKCLEPFFSTKGERGTGLGLAMVFGMVQRHSCALEIDSAPGAGTTMRLQFAVPTGAIVEPGQPAPAREAPKHLRLLLVDDDPVLIKSLRDALEADGHVVATASGGEAGIAEFRASLQRGRAYAAVITDLGMPYVDGRKVAAAVKEASPATPVLLLTGWGQRMVAEGEVPAHVDRVLAKPPKLRELREALAVFCGTDAG